jgi:uncharacterized membrane protein YjfL (UPF0719 family)
MNTRLVYLASAQLILALILAILVTFFSYKIFRYFLVKRYQIQMDNFAFALLSSSILFSVGYIISGTLQPAMNVIRILGQQTKSTVELFLESVRYISLFVGIGFVISSIITLLGLFIFTQLTRNINEFEEISKDNKAVGLITGVIIIVIAMFVKDSTVLLLESFIPYPKLLIN